MFTTLNTTFFRIHGWALVALLIFNGLIFYTVLFNIPAVWTGESTLVRDELVPFYDWKSQFIDQLTEPGPSELTQTEEVRVGYSFWTSWVRYSPFLPIGVFVFAMATSFFLYLSSYLVLVKRSRLEKTIISGVSLLTILPVYSVLLYSKFTHFYTLVFGFSLFALAASLCIRWTLQTEFYERTWSPIFMAAFLVLINPAIHYHVIFYIFLMLLMCYVVLQKILIQEKLRIIGPLCVLIAISIIPYGLLILYIMGLSEVDVANAIPVNFQGIVSASSNIMQILSFDIAGQTDMFLNGSYLVLEPRVSKLIWFSGLVLAFFAFNRVRTNWRLETFLLTVAVISLWMSIGYTYAFSFHSLLADSAFFIQNTFLHSFDILKKMIVTTVQILRYPHRFLFIFYYTVTVLGGLLVVSMIEYNQSKRKSAVVLSALTVIVVLPFFFAQDLRSLFTGGDMNGFISFTDLHTELALVSTQITDDGALSFVLPTMESGRELVDGDQRLSFIDKFLIYALDKPVFYYGSGAKPENKILASLVYMSIVSGGDTWQYILANSLNIEYVLYPKTTERDAGFVYFSQIDTALLEGLNDSVIYEPVYETEHFYLFKRKLRMPEHRETLVALNENNVLTFLQKYPLGAADRITFLSGQSKIDSIDFVYTDNLAMSYYDLFSVKFPERRKYPQNFLVPFSDKLVSSTYYNATPLSFEALLSSTNYYNFVGDAVFDFANLQSGAFIAQIKAGGQIEFVVPEKWNGQTEYALIKASARSEELSLVSRNKKVKISLYALDAENESGFRWYLSREPIVAGEKYSISASTLPFSVESLLLVSADDLFREDEMGNVNTQIVFGETVVPNQYQLSHSPGGISAE